MHSFNILCSSWCEWVHAVGASNILVQADEVVKGNNLAEKVIALHGRVEEKYKKLDKKENSRIGTILFMFYVLFVLYYYVTYHVSML